MNEQLLKRDISVTLAGLFVIFGSQYLNVELGLLFLVLGTIACCFGMYGLLKDIHKLPSQKSIVENKTGLAYVWAVAAATLAMCSILWFSLSWPAVMIMDWATSFYGFNSYTLGMINFARIVVGTVLAFVVFGVLIYVLVNANRRSGADAYVGY